MTTDPKLAALEAHAKALLMQRAAVTEQVAIDALVDRANKISSHQISPRFDEDIYVVLNAQWRAGRDTAQGWFVVGVCSIIVGVLVGLFGVMSWFVPVTIIVGATIGFFAYKTDNQNDQNFWAAINRMNDLFLNEITAERPELNSLDNGDHPLTGDPASVFDNPRRH